MQSLIPSEMIHCPLSEWAMWLSLLQQSTSRCLPNIEPKPHDKGRYILEMKYKAWVNLNWGLSSSKFHLNHSAFLPQTPEAKERRKAGWPGRRQHCPFTREQRKRLPKKKRRNINPQKHPIWIQKHEKGKKKYVELYTVRTHPLFGKHEKTGWRKCNTSVSPRQLQFSLT